jgi:hypothetical protein
MACCILGALLIGQVMMVWKRIRESRRSLWLAASIFFGTALLTVGAQQMSTIHQAGAAPLFARCLGISPSF